MSKDLKEFLAAFEESIHLLTDPRIDRSKLHPLENVLFISFCATICGAQGWDEVEEWGNSKRDLLEKYLDLSNGIPSHDTFGRVFARLVSAEFEQFLIHWVTRVFPNTAGQVVALDGKTLRGSHDKNHKARHILNAWANSSEIVLGQLAVEAKTNEITAIPELIDKLSIENQIITIDAMGCQKEIATKIIDRQADYILALKGNHAEFLDQVKSQMAPLKFHHETLEKDHGRIERRQITVLNSLTFIDNAAQWAGLKTVVRIEAQRNAKGLESSETRYYISSLNLQPDLMLAHIRSHWGIENKLHWMLDVCFREDAGRGRAGAMAQNLSILYKMALNLLKHEKTYKGSIRRKRMKAGWDDAYLISVLNGLF